MVDTMMAPDEHVDINQSAFESQQRVLQAPELQKTVEEPAKKSKVKLIVLLGSLAVFLMVLAAAIGPRQTTINNLPAASPTPSPTQKPVSEKDAAFSALADRIQLSNPEDVILVPPQVDMMIGN